MASVDLRDSSQLLWIEIHGVTITDDKVDEVEVAIRNSEGKEEMESKTVDKKKGDGKAGKSELLAMDLKAKCIAFAGDTIIVMIPRGVSTKLKNPFKPSPKESQDHSSPQEIPASIAIQSLDTQQAKDGHTFEYPLKGTSITLRVTMRSLGALSGSSVDDSKLSENYDKLEDKSLADRTLNAVKDLASTLEESADLKIVDAAVKTVKSFAEAHPLLKIAVTALCIPYEMWKQKLEFEEDLIALARDMCTSLESIVEAYPSIESKHAKETVIKLVRLILRASAYVESFSKNDGLSKANLLKEHIIRGTKQTVRAQFPKRLDDYRNDLRDCRLDFREVIFVDMLTKSGAIKDRDDVSFLQRKLKPSEQSPMDDKWLKGSRATVMSDVDIWLRSCDKPNVLWISGAPGAGKSAIASEIVKKLHDSSSEFYETHSCARFSIKRGHATLDDPRTIWRSIAMELVELSLTDRWYRSIKVDLLEVMSQKANNLYPDVSIEKQFRDLIYGPLKKLFELTAGVPPSRTIVIVIDALDECNISDTKKQERFLDTVMSWSRDLPGTCKLVLTSRVEPPIEEKLEKISQPLKLDTGDDVSNESIRDIILLFEKGFEGKKVERKQIEKLAKYAAGLFIWATTVVEYVNKDDFGNRLKEVLANMSAAGARGGDGDKIGTLYGQILFTVAWGRRTNSDELDRFSLVMASVIPGILRRPLQLRSLGALSCPDPKAINDVIGIAGKLNSVIASDGADKTPRICHKSFPDFLSDEHRVIATMKWFIKVEDAEESDRERFLNAFSLVHQRALIAKSCLQLMVQCTKASEPTISLNTDISTALVYACTHWVDHIPDAEAESDATGSFYFEPPIYSAPPGETLSSLQERTLHWLKASYLPETSPGSDAVLQKSAGLINVLHELWSFLVAPAEKLFLEAMQRFANTHPIICCAKTMLNVAGGLPLEEQNITKDLVTDICNSLMYVTGDHPEAGREYPKHCAAEFMAIIVESSRYVIDFKSKSVSLADFRKELSDYRNLMRDCRRESILVPNLIGKGLLKDGRNIESFLHDKLEPVTQAPDDDECLEGTREQILSSVYDWLASEKANVANVFWISAPAGAGKTALASSIVKKVSEDHSNRFKFFNCAKFFIKEWDPDLREPRALWRSISAQLASEPFNRGIKLDHLELLCGDAGDTYPGNAVIQDQFCDLIREPLKKQFPSDSVSPRRTLVVIDALDECDIHSKVQRSTFLDTVVSWSKELPRTCKLLVTSRPEPDIEGKLNCSDIHRLKVESGDVNSRASDEDIQRFFETKLKDSESAWSSPKSITDLTRAANGVFAWATTIAEFIRCNSAKRPNDVKELLDVVAGESNAREDNLDYLYGQILFKVASQLSGPQDLDILSVVLASVSLPRNPITFAAVRKLLPPDYSSSNIMSVIENLGPVICLTGSKNNLLRACHRSFSDFLRGAGRYRTTMKSVVDTSSAKHDAFFSALSLEQQRFLFEEGYFRLLNTCCQRAYSFMNELADIHGQRDEQWIKEVARRLPNSKILRADEGASAHLDALFLLTDAWLRCEDNFVSTKMKALKLRAIIDVCHGTAPTNVNPYIWFDFVALLDPTTIWSEKHKCADDNLAIKLRESLNFKDTSGLGWKHFAMGILDSLAAALKCLDDYSARFACSLETRVLAKYCADLEVYQSSMRYWELELRGVMSQNLEGSVDVHQSLMIGEGGFAKVYKGSASLDNGSVEVAVKVLKPVPEGNEEERSRLIKGFVEASHVRGRFNHPNVLKCLGYIRLGKYDHDSVATIHPLVKGGHINVVELEIQKAFSISLGIAKGMCFLHYIGILHGDLKSHNVLVSDSDEALIIMSSNIVNEMALGASSTSQRWTPHEYYHLDGGGNFLRTQKCDVWAFGMTVLELLTGRVPYAVLKSDGQVARAILEGKLPSKPTIDDSDPDAGLKHFMWSICHKCWRLKPEERPSMHEILEEMLDYPLKDTHSVPGDEEFSSGIEHTGEQPHSNASSLEAFDLD